MAYARYEYSGEVSVGWRRDTTIFPLDAGSVGDLRRGSPQPEHSRSVPTADVRLLPPVTDTSRIIGVGMNYYDALPVGVAAPAYPVFFTKFVSCLIGAYDPIEMPSESVAVDAEGELAIVIGRRGRRIPESSAIDHVLGCTVTNDVTVRDFQSLSAQWLQGKAWDSTTPLGPWIVPYEDISPDARIRTMIDGVLVQDGCIDQMIFSVPKLISLISTFMTLEVGDVILTGTPAGNGHNRTPRVYLTEGQTIEVSIDGIGSVRNVVTAG
ncbi:hypothetical protein ASG84_25945 [Rhodococcus sp. Leaf278]|uniref:fumarylacetoacetate hydrolase family protein n=1 Tax=Rhodococcus sp. Leaf278 TaxID=1736319 RepID=UPI00070CFE72|nr:fumarylacetoacetate hydrolase family protein [Rhodococcus sp. Leaf278]KQU50504.1 hypothetical protein ASG84_25945 [Rhodococcus sp. Leaf278]